MISIMSSPTDAKKIASNQADKMGELDYSYHNAMDEVHRMLNGIMQVANNHRIIANGVAYQPGSFASSAEYRLIAVTDDMIDNMANRFFGADGSLDHFKVGHTLVTEHELSPLELQVLTQLFSGVSVQDIIESYGMAYLIRVANQNPEHLRLLGIYTDTDFRAHVEMLSQDGRYAGTALINTDSPALQQLADAFSANVMQDAERILMSGRAALPAERNSIESTLQQAQIFSFLNSIGFVAPAEAFSINLGGSGADNYITFWDQRFNATSASALLGTSYARDMVITDINIQRNTLNQQLANLENSRSFTNAMDTLGNIVSSTAGYMPLVGTPISIVRTGTSVAGHITDFISDNSAQLNQQELTLHNQMLTMNTHVLGGGVATIQVPNGYHVVGVTLARPDAVINIAGLYNEYGITLGDALTAWGTDDAAWRSIQNFTGGDCVVHDQFVITLSTTLRENRDEINSMFITTHPNIGDIYQVELLPAEVLEHVISLAR